MNGELVLSLDGLSSRRDLWIKSTKPLFEEQLREQGRKGPNGYRYEVGLEVLEGKRRPAADVDNYAKKLFDAVTKTKLLWRDDKQVDILIVRRRRDRNQAASQVTIRIKPVEGQHAGAPAFFRACCQEARQGRWGYSHPGFQLASALGAEQPYDLEEDEWADRVEELCSFLATSDREGALNWFREHFPRCMALVPTGRRWQFMSGVERAYEEGRIEM